MAQKLLIRDLTLRDGQQSAFATRMKQEQIDRVLPFYKDANFYAMEVWGGAVPDSVMRYLNENPWDRLEKIHAVVGDVSKLTALSRGRNLFGYAPYTDEIIEGFSRNAIESGLGIMRIFDALNDVNNVKSTIKYIKKYGGIADCAVCYTIDPHFSGMERFKAMLKGKRLPKAVFTDEYFLSKAQQMAALGADMITIKDMSGLIPPKRVSGLIKLFKKHLSIPIDFHTHCTPGYGLASVVAAIEAGADIVDTNIWNFAGGPAAPAIELIWIFCQKMGVELDINMEAVAKINKELYAIRKELDAVDAVKVFPNPFNPLTDKLPEHIDKEFDRAVAAAKSGNETELIDACHAIERYFNFPKPNELVQKAEIPGGMYTNMVAQLKQLKSESILESAMKLIPRVRLDAGLPPLVTPTSQIVGAQAVNCALDIKNGKPMYSNVSNQFVNLVKGEYGKTPVEHLRDVGLFERPVLAAHCVYVNDSDIGIMARYGVSVAHNPQSNMKLASGIAPVVQMLAAGVNVGIGTDGPSSNNDLDMWEEMRTASLLQKVATADPCSLSAYRTLQMATVHGAKAIGREGELGVIVPGALADLLLVDMERPHLSPRNDLIANLAYCGKASDVDTVFVGGEIVVEGGRLLTSDVRALCREAGERVAEIKQRG